VNLSESEKTADQLLRRIAVVLLRLGIDVPNAQRLLRKAFVFAVREKTRASGARATQSQIASMTGMSRLEVRTILASKTWQHVGRQSTRVDQLVTAWRTNPLFLDAGGRPKSLDLKGSRGSFEQLVKKYGRDVTSKTLRDELVSRGIASLRNQKLILKGPNNKLHAEMTAAASDLRFVVSLLEGMDLHSGRRTFTTKRISVAAQDRKAVQMLKGIAIRRIDTVMSSLTEMSTQKPRPIARSNQRTRRLVITATVSSETED
jgi:hypothetical protein